MGELIFSVRLRDQAEGRKRKSRKSLTCGSLRFSEGDGTRTRNHRIDRTTQVYFTNHYSKAVYVEKILRCNDLISQNVIGISEDFDVRTQRKGGFLVISQRPPKAPRSCRNQVSTGSFFGSSSMSVAMMAEQVFRLPHPLLQGCLPFPA
jgi:hypothetical protein